VPPDNDLIALYGMMREAWGAPLADALIDRIPPMNTADIATRQDLEHTTIVLRGEMAELRSGLRSEMAELRAELRGEMTELRAELRNDMTELRAELRNDMGLLRAEFRASSRHTLVTIVAAAVSIWLTFYLPAVI